VRHPLRIGAPRAALLAALAAEPAASVVAVLLTWMLVTPGDISIRRKYTNARRTGSPVAAFDTWPLTEQGSSGLVWAASASGTNKNAPIQRMISEWHSVRRSGQTLPYGRGSVNTLHSHRSRDRKGAFALVHGSRSAGNRARSKMRRVNSSMVRYLSCSRSR